MRTLCIAAVATGIAGCGAAKKTVRTPTNDLDFANSSYVWVGKGTLHQNGRTSSFKVTIKFYKDSLIWANIGAMGVEGARIMVVGDTVRLLNRIERKFVAYAPLSVLARHPHPVGMLTRLLAGRLKTDELARLAAENEAVEIRHQASDGLVTALNVKTRSGALSLRVEDRLRARGLDVPQRCRIHIEGQKIWDVELNFDAVRREIAPVRPGFVIPKDYARESVSMVGIFD
ncbi:MAG: DUF4292 domain-containing protein [Bacteroidia bacterium]|nr:DUF4292 domain-containing protein [Bacteroidia bacterium]MDW8334417.1 DUF4292 domain-containing protein [Bacteroidia bacterium]